MKKFFSFLAHNKVFNAGDFGKDVMDNFLKNYYYLHMIFIGGGLSLGLSYLLIFTYIAQFTNPLWGIPLNIAITWMLSYMAGMFIEMIQQDKDSVEAARDIRFTGYGWLPGNIMAGLMLLAGLHNFLMPLLTVILLGTALYLHKKKINSFS